MIALAVAMFAQSVVEYGALVSMTAAVQRALYSAQEWIGDQGASTWIVVGGVLVLGLAVLRFRRSRI